MFVVNSETVALYYINPTFKLYLKILIYGFVYKYIYYLLYAFMKNEKEYIFFNFKFIHKNFMFKFYS